MKNKCFLLKILLNCLLLTLSFQSLAAIQNECLETSTNDSPYLNELFGEHTAIPLFSKSENRVDLEKKKSSNRFKLIRSKKSQVIEAERFFFVQNKKLHLDGQLPTNKQVVGIVFFSNFKSNSVLGVKLSQFKFVETQKTVRQSITPGREILHHAPLIDVLKAPTESFDFSTETRVPIQELLTSTSLLKSHLPLLETQQTKNNWSPFVFILNQSLALSTDFFLKGRFSMKYKYDSNVFINSFDFLSNMVSGSRIDNCIYLIVQ